MANSDELFRACGTLLRAIDWIGKAAIPSLEKMESEFRQQPSLVPVTGSVYSSVYRLRQLGADLTNRWAELKMLAEIAYAEEQAVKAAQQGADVKPHHLKVENLNGEGIADGGRPVGE